MFDTSTKELILNTDLSFAKSFVNAAHYNQMSAIKEHYRLMAYLSKQVDNQIVYDIGTYKGLSGIAMSANISNKVISYDIVNYLEVTSPSNVEFKIGNCYEDPQLLNSPLILLDVDPHDGIFETKFVSWLNENNYKGMVVFDDIHLNFGMQNFWNNVSNKKFDVTDVGHYSGTGIAIFD